MVNENHYELLRDAIFDNNQQRFEELLKQFPIDVDHLDAGGQTLLHLASFWGRMGIVKVLLSSGASMKLKNAAGCTALDLATHWGHTSVAEVIRMRGGSSVWEDKMGSLQVEVENLRTRLEGMIEENTSQKKENERLTEEFLGLHQAFEEEKSQHLFTRHHFDQLQSKYNLLMKEKILLTKDFQDLSEKYKESLLEKAKMEFLKEEAQKETLEMLQHRDEILVNIQNSVQKQQEVTLQWQKAEAAAIQADSMRNFAFAERDRIQKIHTAALGEIVLLNDRLNASENELMEFKIRFAKNIYEAKQKEIRQKKVVSTHSGGIKRSTNDTATTSLAFSPPKEMAGSIINSTITTTSRPISPSITTTAPDYYLPTKEHKTVDSTAVTTTTTTTTTTTIAPPNAWTKTTTPTTSTVTTMSTPETQNVLTINSSSTLQQQSNSTATITTTINSGKFSLAAREFTEKIRQQEKKKQIQREKKTLLVETNFLRQGKDPKILQADQFQQEFVSTLKNFQETRKNQWKDMKIERDQQMHFAKTMLSRPICTAPALAKSLFEKSEKHFAMSKSSLPDLSATDISTNSKTKNTVGFSVYAKYADVMNTRRSHQMTSRYGATQELEEASRRKDKGISGEGDHFLKNSTYQSTSTTTSKRCMKEEVKELLISDIPFDADAITTEVSTIKFKKLNEEMPQEEIENTIQTTGRKLPAVVLSTN